MMMIPRRHDFDLIEDMFRDPFFDERESRVMKTDIKIPFTAKKASLGR